MALKKANLVDTYSNFYLPSFTLINIDAQQVNSLDSVGEKGVLVMFICNHCPYVKNIINYIVQDAGDLAKLGIKTIAINSNDYKQYPEDSPEKMKEFASNNQFTFPYLLDESQEVAHKFNAVCTPDFFLFFKDTENQYILKYKGRLNNYVYGGLDQKIERELYEAAKCILDGRKTPEALPSIGCSIKFFTE